MDPQVANILGIKPVKPSNHAPMIRKRPLVTMPTINEQLKGFGLPPVAESEHPLVQAFHVAAIAAIAEETRGVLDAINQIDPGYTSEVKNAKTAGLLRMGALALQSRLVNVATPVVRMIEDARTIVDSAMDRCPKDATGSVRWQLAVEGVRTQLASMTKGEQIKAAQALADRADPTFPAVFLDSLKSYLPDPMAVELTGVYQRAFAGDKADLLDQAEAALVEVSAICQCADLAMSSAANSYGIPGEWRNVSTAGIVKAWSQAAKSKFIATAGEAAYVGLLDGYMGLDVALSVFRPGLVGEGN